jgi:hypothetical protein
MVANRPRLRTSRSSEVSTTRVSGWVSEALRREAFCRLRNPDPKGRYEIATTVRSWAQIRRDHRGPKGRQELSFVPALRASWFSIPSRSTTLRSWLLHDGPSGLRPNGSAIHAGNRDSIPFKGSRSVPAPPLQRVQIRKRMNRNKVRRQASA